MSDWGQGSKNNNIGWGQGAVNNSISWGLSHSESWAGDTDINGGTPYDADYQAILDYATTQGYTLPSDAQKTLQNQLLVDLKASGVWAKLDTFANFATDGDSNYALIDWKRLTQYTAVNSPTFTVNKGYAGNGTSSYINTNFNPAIQGVNYTLNNASRYLYLSNSVSGNTNFMDGNNSDNNCSTRGNVFYQRINQGTTNLNSAFNFTSVVGMKSIHRTSSTDVQLFNETTQESRVSSSTSVSFSNQFILRNSVFYGTSQVSFYAMGASLISENTAFVNAYNTYINSL